MSVRINELMERNARGEPLSWGHKAKILHRLPEAERGPLRAEILTHQERFWLEWTDFRMAHFEDTQPNFYHVVGLTPVQQQFATFVDPQAGDLIVDLMGGCANMADHVAGAGLAGWFSIDQNPRIRERASARLAAAKLQGEAICHNLANGLPEGFRDRIAALSPRRVHWISNWGVTYLDVERFLALLSECLDPALPGEPPVLDLNMITEGRFNRDVLTDHFTKEIVPQNLLHPIRLRRAFSALQRLRIFAEAFQHVSPIWFPDELTSILQEAGFVVERQDSTLLWGQCTAMRIRRPPR